MSNQAGMKKEAFWWILEKCDLNVLNVQQPDIFHKKGPVLGTYKTMDGSIIREVIQAIRWSAGPITFICLEDACGKRFFQWEDKDIANYIQTT